MSLRNEQNWDTSLHNQNAGMSVAKVKCGVSRSGQYESAFSRVELLAVLAVLALLAIIQSSALAHIKGNSHRAVCADNLRRLALSWLMYADDNRGRLAPNGDSPSTNNWVSGVLDFSGTDNTNLARITQAKLYPYNKAVTIYRCPDDLSAVRGQLRIRSYSMSGWVGEGTIAFTSGFQTITNRSQLRQPDQTFVFIEEHPDSINDGLFVVDMTPGPGARIIDFPAAYHYYGANVGFADGSAHSRHWLDPRTSPVRLSFLVPSPNNPDVAWLQSISTYRQ